MKFCRTACLGNTSDLSNLVQRTIEIIHAENKNINEACEYAIKLILWELLSNIYKYSSDPTKRVTIQLQMKDHSMCIKITDHGEGFCWEEQMDHQPFLPDEGYRGIFLIKHFAKEFRFDESGNTAYIIIDY